jgi:hypothetical protein
MMENSTDQKINIYRKLCSKEPTIPIYSQAWWLDSTAGVGGWDVVLVEENGQIMASMPFVVKRKLGFTIITQPPLTQALGPWLRPVVAKYSSNLSLQKKRIQLLFSQLPSFHYFQQSWHYSMLNCLPAYWLGYTPKVRYTYIIKDIRQPAAVLQSFDSSYRNKIKKSERLISIKQSLPIEQFYRINSLTFDRQKMNIPYSLEYLRHHDLILADNNKREIFYAEDSAGRIHSALYLTWDARSAYVHMVGEDPELRSSGAGIALIWHSIRYTAEVLNLSQFDFEGSMLESVEPVRRDCGGEQQIYIQLTKINSHVLGCGLFLRELIGGS